MSLAGLVHHPPIVARLAHWVPPIFYAAMMRAIPAWWRARGRLPSVYAVVDAAVKRALFVRLGPGVAQDVYDYIKQISIGGLRGDFLEDILNQENIGAVWGISIVVYTHLESPGFCTSLCLSKHGYTRKKHFIHKNTPKDYPNGYIFRFESAFQHIRLQIATHPNNDPWKAYDRDSYATFGSRFLMKFEKNEETKGFF